MKVKELTELLSRADENSEVIFCLEQPNKRYPVEYLNVEPQYPVSIQEGRVLLCGMLKEGDYAVIKQS